METITINGVERQLPVYRMSTAFAYKVFSKDECVEVYFGDRTGSISTGYPVEVAIFGNRDCTESEFLEKYQQVRARLDEIVCPPDRYPYSRHGELAEDEAQARVDEMETDERNKEANIQP